MEREPQEAENLIDHMAQNQQWSGRESSRTTGGGRLEVDQITALTAKLDAMQKAFDKMSVKAVDKQQPQPCEMCGDKGHSYERCPLARRDEDTGQVNYLHNDSSQFQRPPFNNASSSSNNRAFYNNAAFNNSNNQVSQFGPPKPYIAPVVRDFMLEQGKMNQMVFEKLEAINAQLAGLAAQNKASEQMGYQTVSTQPHPGRLPSQPEVNPRGEVKAITLRSGTDYAPPAMQPADNTDRADSTRPVQTSPNAESEHPPRAESTRPAQPVQTNTDTDRVSMTRPVQDSAEGQRTKQASKPPPYRPPVPFPRRLAENKLNEQFANFMQVLKQLHITIPFTDALTQMPTYAKFLKDILTNKRSLGGRETVKLTEQCSAILSSELPPKLEDPGKFSIPCQIGKATIKRALCDLGASVSLMPRSIFERMGVGDLKPTRMTLQLADSSVRLPLGIVEDVPILVGKFYVPVDFVVMEMEEDKDIPVILGRPFLKTARTLIDVENGTLTLRIGDEKVQFNINRAMKYPSEPAVPEACYAIDVVDQSVIEKSIEDYGKSFKNYPDYLAELKEEKIAREKVLTTKAKSDPLEDLTHGPYHFHTARAPQSELTIAPKADTREAHGPHSFRTDRVSAQTVSPPPDPDPHPTNLTFLEEFKALQMVIWNTILEAKQYVIEDSICHTSQTNMIPHGPYQCHTARAPLKWMLAPDPPDLHSANR